MGDLLDTFKSVAGDAWCDEWADKLSPVGAETPGAAASAAVAKATDAEKAKRLAAENARKAAVDKAKQLEEQLAAAGDVDEALAKEREATALAQAERDALAAELRQRKLASAARKALAGHKLEDGSVIPPERIPAAQRLMSLDGVDLDENGDAVGIEASVSALASSEGWLWVAPADPPDPEADKKGGHGGKRAGGDPPPKLPKPGKLSRREEGAQMCDLAFTRGKQPEARA